MYAIVDIETTGGYAAGNRITEIAIISHDGNGITDEYSTLINPGRSIPDYITGLTGISDRTVEGAPEFKDVAETIHEKLKDKIFIAHNVHFDFSFVKKQMEEAGFPFNPKKLCTVRLSRKLIPGLSSYGLGNLAESLGIKIDNRHRAGGDAKATAIVFNHLLERDTGGVIQTALKRESRETRLPPNLPIDEFNNLPELPGVYYFLDKTGKAIYVGKAINIKKRISGHFSGSGTTWSNTSIRNEIHHIDYELTGNELIAFLHEASEIKRLWPRYNKAQKTFSTPWHLMKYTDGNGYDRLVLNKGRVNPNAEVSFHTHSEGWEFLNTIIKEYELCPRLCGVQKTTGACYNYQVESCLGACIAEEESENYNARLAEALSESLSGKESFIVRGQGREEEEQSFVLIEEGSYRGYGYLPGEITIEKKEKLYDYLIEPKESKVSMAIVNSFLRRELVKAEILPH